MRPLAGPAAVTCAPRRLSRLTPPKERGLAPGVFAVTAALATEPAYTSPPVPIQPPRFSPRPRRAFFSAWRWWPRAFSARAVSAVSPASGPYGPWTTPVPSWRASQDPESEVGLAADDGAASAGIISRPAVSTAADRTRLRMGSFPLQQRESLASAPAVVRDSVVVRTLRGRCS